MDNNSHIQIVLRDGAAPESVRLRDLFFLLKNLETAIVATAAQEQKGNADVELCLTHITSGSAKYCLSATELGRQAAERISQAINAGTSGELPQAAVHALTKMQRRIARLNHSLTLHNGVFSSTILPSVPLFVDSLVYGATTVFAHVTSIGGKTPTAKLHLPGQGPIVADLPSKALAKELSEHLYSDVTLEGDATWIAGTMQLRSFRVRSIGKFSSVAAASPQAVIAAVRDIAPSIWDGVDPDTYVRDQRD